MRVRDNEGEIRPAFVVGATFGGFGLVVVGLLLWQVAPGLALGAFTLVAFPFVPSWYRALRFRRRKRLDQRAIDRKFNDITKSKRVVGWRP